MGNFCFLPGTDIHHGHPKASSIPSCDHDLAAACWPARQCALRITACPPAVAHAIDATDPPARRGHRPAGQSPAHRTAPARLGKRAPMGFLGVDVNVHRCYRAHGLGVIIHQASTRRVECYTVHVHCTRRRACDGSCVAVNDARDVPHNTRYLR